MSLQVAEEVAATHELGDEVRLLLVLELLNEVHDVEALLDGEHGIAL